MITEQQINKLNRAWADREVIDRAISDTEGIEIKVHIPKLAGYRIYDYMVIQRIKEQLGGKLKDLENDVRNVLAEISKENSDFLNSAHIPE